VSTYDLYYNFFTLNFLLLLPILSVRLSQLDLHLAGVLLLLRFVTPEIIRNSE